jgi:isoleucyl-tRNA synthetase
VVAPQSAASWAQKSSVCGASTDYSGRAAIDDKILARVVDAYRRIHNRCTFLMANVSG